ncbi:MAG: aminotransferase class IV [Phycisphaerales bacterium]|nr:aminotransferase class IV [Phycisphaerales bacterium]
MNGQFVPADEATLSVFDAGVQHGVGLFETMAAANGRVFRAEAHVQRLVDSALQLRLSERLQVEPLVEAVQLALEHNSMAQARVRLTVTGGNLNMLQSSGTNEHDPTVIVVVQPPTEYPDTFFERGVGVTIASGRLTPWSPGAGHKTVDYWSRIHALQEAATVRAGEALWLTPDASVASGSVSNIFLIKDDVLLTPPSRTECGPDDQPSPVLPGITRQAVLELAKGRRIERRVISIDELLGADEVFLTNSSWHVLPVTSLLLKAKASEDDDTITLQQHQIGDGGVGSVTSDLRTALLALIEQETTS